MEDEAGQAGRKKALRKFILDRMLWETEKVHEKCWAVSDRLYRPW